MLRQASVSPHAASAGSSRTFFNVDSRIAIGFTGLILVLVLQGAAITQSYLWAAPLLCLLVVAVAPDLPLAPLLGAILVIRVLTDDLLFSATSRHTGSFNLSGLIAVVFALLAVGLSLRHKHGIRAIALTILFLSLWTVVAVVSHGASTVTVREGVREASIVALGVIVYNSRGVITTSVATRLIQIAGLGSALLAIYQLATHSGMLVAGEIRSNGTFTHPNGAAVFFAIAAVTSLWRYLDHGRARSDAAFCGLFAAATITTFSLSGLASLLAMLITFGALRPGSYRLKFGAYATAVLIVVAFLATPLGAERIANESSTQLSSSETRGTANTSLAWRFYKWRTLIPEWERAPLLGQGLGTTITVEGTSEYVTAGKVPHNEYVRYLVETGIAGLAVLVWAIVLLIRSLSRRRGDPLTGSQAALGIAIVVGCLVNGLVDNTLLYTTTGYALALTIAAVLSLPTQAPSRPIAVGAR
jgi:O-antigen ligase